MNGAKPKRSRRGDGCCEPLPQSIGAKKGLGLGLRLSFLKLRSQSESEDCSEPLSQSQGQIGYAIVPIIARGIMLVPDKFVILHLLDIKQAAESLNGIRMEMTDAAFPLLKGLVATTDVVEACKDVNIAVMLGGYPRKEITLRKDMLSTSVSIYKAQALALEEHDVADCKVTI
ncbi:malate dehydrogenase, cytoplasmic-like [Quercus lobata]|nr:malate dehydrogenase, cytoplasmic-like [Quercus lobata]